MPAPEDPRHREIDALFGDPNDALAADPRGAEQPPADAPRRDQSDPLDDLLEAIDNALGGDDYRQFDTSHAMRRNVPADDVLRRADQLFGNPEDTAANQGIARGDIYRPAEKPQPAPAAEAHETSAKIRLPEETGAPGLTGTPDEPPRTQQGFTVYPSFGPHAVEPEEDEPPPMRPPAPPPVDDGPIDFPSLDEEPAPPQASPPERARAAADAAVPAAELPTQRQFDDTIDSGHLNARKAETYRGTTQCDLEEDGRYALLIAPRSRVDMAVLAAVMGPVLGLSPEGTRHAILRRRGILIENQPLSVAAGIANQLSHCGQPVLLVLQHRCEESGEPADLMMLEEHDGGLRLATAAEVFHCRWGQVICLGAGQVRLAPGAPPRRVLDLLLHEPARHFRAWEATVRAKAPDLGAQNPTLREIAGWLVARCPQAIHTRSLESWIAGSEPDGLPAFASLIEYHNFMRWHVLAHYAPAKPFRGRRRPPDPSPQIT